jgi:hypothetical protein
MGRIIDFRWQRVKSLLSSGGISVFARKIDAVLALLAHSFFLDHSEAAFCALGTLERGQL